MKIPFDNTYARLPAHFFAPAPPTPVAQPRLLALNEPLASLLGLDAAEWAGEAGVAVLAGNRVPEGAQPIALAYAGHQFGGFVPQLGDGRAILLGELVGADGRRREVQLKGAGRTAFSRRGDGRAALGPVLREYLVSEAMHALGVPTTRALAAVATGETLLRDGPVPGAVLTRVAESHVRVGTFEYFAARGDRAGLERLTAHVLARHHGPVPAGERPALHLLDRVISAQANLVAQWLGLGFVHGVMNTDNTSISGETLDYGPCAFLDAFRPSHHFSSIDQHGRYAFDQQPRILLWNLTRLAEALLPLVADDEDEAARLCTERLEQLPGRLGDAHLAVLRRKLGLLVPAPGDQALAAGLLEVMAAQEADFTLTFRGLVTAAHDDAALEGLAQRFASRAPFDAWALAWRARLASEATTPEARAAAMSRANPVYLPRNHLVEAVIAAAQRDDLGPFRRLHGVLARPYDVQAGAEDLATPPGPEQWGYRTFCGT